MRISKRLLASVFAAAASVGLAQAGTELVTNGNFASTSPNTTVSTQFGTSYKAGQFVTGWTGNNGYEIWFPNAKAASSEDTVGQYTSTGKEMMYSVGAVPGGNTAFVGLDGDTTNGVQSSLSQTIDNLVKGSTYDVSFYWGAGQMQSRTGATTEQLAVSLGSATQYTDTLHNPSASFTGWYHDVMQFTAAGTSELLNFLSIGSPVGEPPMAVLTGVSVQQTSVPVPEPSSLAILGAGLAGLGLVVRRRRRARKTTKI